MQTFLGAVAQRLLSQKAPLENQIVVLPTQRAASFLKQILITESGKNTWLPEFTTLNNWAERISGLRAADHVHLKFACFEAYQKVLGNTAQDLSGFFSWADVLLGDFNDIESYMVSPEVIFKELKDYTDIEHFSFLNEPLSEKQVNYQKFWKAIPEIHKLLNEKLLAEKVGYNGLVMRKAAESWPAFQETHPDTFVTVAGFNALSGAETRLLKQMQASAHAEVLFDADAYYLNEKENHAGFFLRRNQQNGIGQQLFTKTSLAERPIKVSLCEATTRIDQAGYVAAILEAIPKEDLSETALVLADESLLIPILNRLPANITAANITMGINLADTGFAGWLRALWEMHETGSQNNGVFQFTTETQLALLKHPVSRLLFKSSGAQGPDAFVLAQKENYIPAEVVFAEAKKQGWNWVLPLLADWDFKASNSIDALSKSIPEIKTILAKAPEKGVEIRLVSEAVTLLERLLFKSKNQSQFAELRPAAYLGILQRELAGGSLAIVGDLLNGLQVMGLLETRALGFKHMILCGANEEVLPKNARIDSFIPFEIRSYHRLPGKKEKEAVYAYHFYRLLQHAERADLVFHTDTNDLKGGEKSRYVQQLVYELSRANPQLQIRETGLKRLSFPDREMPLLVVKTPDVIAQIKTSLQKRVSASSINKFLESPLEWYYRHVLGLKEPDTNRELDPATFGNLFHETIEHLQEPLLNKIITPADIDGMLGKAQGKLEIIFAKNELSRNFQYGLNRIQFEMAKKMLIAYLKSEKAAIAAGNQVQYLSSEQVLNRELVFDYNGEEMTVHFLGKADSITRWNGNLNIIDFKTGRVEAKDLKLASWDIEAFRKNPKAFQLLLYNWLVKPLYPAEPITAQIISMPAASNRELVLANGIQTADDEVRFENVLIEIFKLMLDTEADILAEPEFKYNVYE